MMAEVEVTSPILIPLAIWTEANSFAKRVPLKVTTNNTIQFFIVLSVFYFFNSSGFGFLCLLVFLLF
ncbi:MAG: hypothetical protein ACYS72_03530, partial [Planctomycetota bacterium]